MGRVPSAEELLEGVHFAIYYNEWRDHQVAEVTDCFERLDRDGIEILTEGDEIWNDPENLHLRGKVSGYVKSRVTGIQTEHDGRIISYEGAVSGGRFGINAGKVHRLTDRDGLKRLIGLHGTKITQVYSEAELVSQRAFAASQN